MTEIARFSNVQRILVRSTNWVGDAVMSLPALDALRACFPRAEIVLLSKPSVSEALLASSGRKPPNHL